ncbi:MAG: ATP-binding protein [Candidatus Rokuibacteriota bacterium]
MPYSVAEAQPRAIALFGRALVGGRVAHAYALVGPTGSGRSTAALSFSEALLCERASPNGGCGHCRACVLVAKRQHPDLHLIVPTPPEKNPRGPKVIRIDDIRELERRAALRPAMGMRKVFIVDDADRMTADTPQAFLKTLEEPPDRTVLILVLPTVRALPATVLSRCQIIRCTPRPDLVAAEARAGALTLVAEVRTKGADALFRRLQTIDRDKAEVLIDAYWLWCRDLLVVQSGAPAALVAHASLMADIAREAERWTMEDLLAEMADCRAARAALETNVSPRLTVEMLLSRLATRAA